MARKKKEIKIESVEGTLESPLDIPVQYKDAFVDPVKEEKLEVKCYQPTDEDTSIIEDNLLEIDIDTILEEKFGKSYFDFLKKSGLDVSFKGAWQSNLVQWLNFIFSIRNKSVLDIGCSAGAMVQAFHEFGCRSVGVDISKYALSLTKFKNLKLLHLPAWKVKELNSTFDFIYSMETFALFPENKIEDTMKAINSIMNKGGIFIASVKYHKELLDTHELSSKTPEEWSVLLDSTGFEDITKETISKMKKLKTPFDYYNQYEWNIIVGRKK